MTLELRDIRKRFGAVRANDGVSLTVERGELRGLLGENGAGKSTLMKILSGFVAADSGEVALNGTKLSLRSPAEAIKAGIGMLHQDPLVFLPMSVLDNFLLGSPGRALVDRKLAETQLAELSGRFGFSFDAARPGPDAHRRRAPAARDHPAAVAGGQGAGARRADDRHLGHCSATRCSTPSGRWPARG